MDRHSTARVSLGRQPLADTTNRVNNAAINDKTHTLKSKKTTTRGRTNPSVPIISNPPQPSPVSQEYYDAQDPRRASQFSNVSSNASSTRQLKTHIGPWQLGKTLGKGSSARVRLARHRISQQLVAIKIVSKSTAHINQAGSLANLDHLERRKPPTPGSDGGIRRMPLSIEREVAILKLIEHPNIIKLLDIWENRSEIYMVTEYVEKGDMFEFINWNGALNEDEAMFYFRQIMSALEYCHSLNICHRDLKPENILLKGNGQVKIADFGMAALQQNPNHQLQTACGSPHYAAPELLRHQPYKGSAVDIWSMGVILYAMLAGRLPFDDPDMNIMLAKAKRADYTMPRHLSIEAQDLIRRILISQPAQRITMKNMWKHQLVKNYDYLDQYLDWEGQPQVSQRHTNIAPIAPDQVDEQILRQLKAVWHAYSEADIKAKLAQEKPNDQKLFYSLLYKHREAQLENYNNNVPISKSDFHHLKPPNWTRRISTCQFTQPGRNGQRTVSKFTVISNIPDVDDTGTIRSYDPFNASRVFPTGPQASHAKIIVHRNNSPEPGVGPSPVSVSHSYRSYRSGGGSSRLKSRMNSQRTATSSNLRSSGGSQTSLRSYTGTPRVRVNPRRSKRNVDFSNIRNRGHNSLRGRTGSVGGAASIAGDNTTYDRDTFSQASPRKQASNYRTAVTKSMADVDESKLEGFVWTEELQQLNTRIAKHCDEAFRSSLLASEPSETGIYHRETSPFTLSLGTESTGVSTYQLNSSLASAHRYDSRPLPPVPSQVTVSPLSIRKENPLVDPSRQTNKISALDPGSSIYLPERRAASDPLYNRSIKEANKLPSIFESTPEEWKRTKVGGKHDVSLGSVETPARVKNRGLDYLARAENTIRVVHSPSAIANAASIPEPLNVRKVSRNPGSMTEPLAQHSRRHASDTGPQTASPIHGQFNDANVQSKKRTVSWFKRTSKEGVSGSGSVDASTRGHESAANSDATNGSRSVSGSTQESSSETRTHKKKSFNLSFWKSNKPEGKMTPRGPESDDMSNHIDEKSKKKGHIHKTSGVAGGANRSVWSDSDAGTRQIEVQQNWLARLFRVKPAMRYLCFSMNKRRARQEVAILLRDWRKYGIKDIEVDKERNIIFARVAAKNHLNLKEVSFAIELMTVIEHGKRGQLSIARFTQEKGAASSFHRVVDAINSSFLSRALVITDRRKVGMMIKTLNS
ncbi:hypothetical protein QBC38DRAFT_451785 [Podospora fimiseda]|uniref:non-specific serine/threonine protein kinase n=1 Tax=Podospora fimiseda TaxID=252190 RepID=A0AAN7H0R1_9PEZI|nr:hypothetical protein QBC38DRAFT_451785 [Podospora fimiseda]